jgi:hypothetical protein
MPFGKLLFRYLFVFLLTGTGVSATARNDVWSPTEDNAVWRSECGVCHVAFPPTLLASEDWLTIMGSLDRHFGVDASLDAMAVVEISDYLKRNGASYRPSSRSDEVALRITDTERFEHKHRGAIRLWKKGQLRTLSDCGSCHKEAGAQR